MLAVWRKHDAGFFTIELPPGWAAGEFAAGILTVHDKHKTIVLTLAAASRPQSGAILPQPIRCTAREAQRELQQWLAAQKQIAAPGAPRDIPFARHATATAEALQRSAKPRRWYQRLIPHRPVPWRFWAVLNPHILVLASCTGSARTLEKLHPILDRILASIHLTEKDILLGRPFTERVAALARAYFPELAVAIIDDAHLQCGSQPVSLNSLHRRYMAAPEDLPTQVKSLIAQVRGHAPQSETARSWLAARPHILPTLVPTSIAEASQRLHDPWINGLSIAYELSENAAARPVNPDDAQRWNVALETLHQQSLRNLILLAHEQTMEVQKSEGYTLLLLAAPERHNAARLLLPELRHLLREHLGPHFYAAMPAQEFLLAFSTPSAEVLARVRQQVAADYARAANALSPKIFLVTPDGVAGDPDDPEDLDW